MNAYTKVMSDPDQDQQPNALPRHDAQELTKGGIQAQIMLGHQTYFLRITRAGKLILTK